MDFKMIVLIADLMKFGIALLGGWVAISSNDVRHWLPRELDYAPVAFVCGFVGGYCFGWMVIQPLQDLIAGLIAGLKRPTPLQQSRTKVCESDDKCKVCAKEQRELEKQAGITELIPEWYDTSPDFDWRTHFEVNEFGNADERRRNDILYHENIGKFYASELRKAYFSVGDLELRKRLIAKEYEYIDLSWSRDTAEKEEAKAILAEADAALEKARSLRKGWLVSACIFAVVLVYLAYEFFGQWAAIAGAVLAIFFGRYLEQASNLRREAEVKDALNAQEKATGELKDLVDGKRSPGSLLFSEQEMKTGERDEPHETALRKYGRIF
jgi:hypothetical protein